MEQQDFEFRNKENRKKKKRKTDPVDKFESKRNRIQKNNLKQSKSIDYQEPY